MFVCLLYLLLDFSFYYILCIIRQIYLWLKKKMSVWVDCALSLTHLLPNLVASLAFCAKTMIHQKVGLCVVRHSRVCYFA